MIATIQLSMRWEVLSWGGTWIERKKSCGEKKKRRSCKNHWNHLKYNLPLPSLLHFSFLPSRLPSPLIFFIPFHVPSLIQSLGHLSFFFPSSIPPPCSFSCLPTSHFHKLIQNSNLYWLQHIYHLLYAFLILLSRLDIPLVKIWLGGIL